MRKKNRESKHSNLPHQDILRTLREMKAKNMLDPIAPQADQIYRRHARKNGWENAPTVRTGATFRLENTGRDREREAGTGGSRQEIQR